MPAVDPRPIDCLPLIRRLSPSRRRELAAFGRWVRFSPGEPIVTARWQSDAVWFLPTPCVRLDGHLLSPHDLPGGLAVGEAGLFGPTRWRQSVVAVRHVDAWRLDPSIVPDDHPAIEALRQEVLAALAAALAMMESGVAAAVAEPVEPIQRRAPRRHVAALAKGLFRGPPGPSLADLVEHRYEVRGRLPMRRGLGLVLDGGVERSTAGRHAETLGVGAWVGLVPWFAQDTPRQVYTARPGTRVLMVPLAAASRLRHARTAEGARFSHRAGRALIQRLDVALLRAAHRQPIPPPPSDAGLPAAAQTTALSAGAHAPDTTPPLLPPR